MIITKRAIPRRTILRGFGTALALPFLDGMVPALTAIGKTAAKPARRLRPTVTLVAFVLGALALAVAYLALHGVQVLAPAPILQPAPMPQRAGRRASIPRR